MRIKCRYGEEKRARKQSIMIPLVIVLLFSINAFIGTGVGIINAKADTIIAVCPPEIEGRECGKVIKEKYYADYEKNSPEYWNTYCNQMLGTKFECI